MDLTSGLTLTADESQLDDGGNGSEVRIFALQGALADRVRMRLAAPDNAVITLTEETYLGGTEWTRDVSTTFTIAAGDIRRTFHPDSSQADWVADQAGSATFDSVYSRFDAWLQVAECPDELRAEWFERTEGRDWWDRWVVQESGALGRALRRRFPKADHFQLERIPEPAAQDYRSRAKLNEVDFSRWRLDAVAVRDARGFAAIIRRNVLTQHSLSEDPSIPDGVLTELSDSYLVGEERL